MTHSPILRHAGWCSATLAGLVGLGAVEPSDAPDPWSALKEGTVSLDARYRYEFVDVESSEKDAHASTLRVRLGYRTARYRGFTGFLEFEGTRVVGNKLYSDPAEPVAGRPVVLDPENAEFNRYWLRYEGVEDLQLTLGRQRIIHDGARFIGNVGWRQNEQTFDAFQARYGGVENLKLEYDFVYNVQRILGEAGTPSYAGLPSSGEDAMASHFGHAAYAFEGIGTLTGFGYLLDYETKDALDTTTFGLAFDGAYELDQEWSLVYAASVASQSDAFDNELDIGETYYWAEIGAKWNSLSAKLGYEVLTGDGDVGFSTPLATVHKFNGWADVLLPLGPTSLPDGLEDLYLTVGGALPAVKGVKGALFYHLLSGYESGDDYGTEFDAVVTWAPEPLPGVQFGAKLAVFSADDDSALADVTKAWLWTQYAF